MRHDTSPWGLAFWALFVSLSAGAIPVWSQQAQSYESGGLQILAGHHPLWANPSNLAERVPSETTIDSLTLVLARPAEKQAAFETFLAAQQDPGSANYHHWLTSAEIGERYGLSDGELAAVTGWLRSNGLQVTFTSPSRSMIGFKGTAIQLAHAFHTTLNYYSVKGERRLAVSSDPKIPVALAASIRTVRGLYTMEDRPMHHARPGTSGTPEITFGGSHYLGPADFATIYDLPANLTGAGATIGIVGRSRTDFADFDNFRDKTNSTFPNPTEIIPTAYGGIDPGPAQTAPSSSGVSDDQLEATLDVLRAGSVAPGASLLLVVSTNAGGGIGADTQYLVETDPAPAQAINLSFGGCESQAGLSGVDFWDSLFQTAAGKGISVFVAAGDSGASGCDTYFAVPPANPAANSPNYICSSSYATCVGGTEFNDTSDPSEYWSSSNGAGYSSALSYIPEGAWNEPLSGSTTQAASGGGGVSLFIGTPTWQTGTGVPSARLGRYTPDIAFSSSGHDGYFGCLAATGYGCVSNSEGEFGFEYFFGTSAAAPDMAGITALLNQKAGLFQGNLNPQIYRLAASTPAAFHDVTVATSGVAGCSVDTPSMCNNSIPGPTGLTGGQAGFLVTAGYDEATGLGSLDVAKFINSLGGVVTATPTFSPAAGTYSTAQNVTIADATTGATIYYTTNGSTPTTSSTKYVSAIPVAATETIKAIAVASGDTSSAVASALYTIEKQVATPVFSPAVGTYTTEQSITITDATAGAVIYYTTNGAVPSAASTKYTGPITIAESTSFKAIAIASGYSSSAVASAAYTINLPVTATPLIAPKAGTYTSLQTVVLADATKDAVIYYTTDGKAPTTASTKYTEPFSVSASDTVEAIAVATGHTKSAVASAVYTLIGSPSALSAPATAIATPKATLNAVVDTLGLAGSYVFQYGTSPTELTSTTTKTTLAASGASVKASAQLTTLKAKTKYYFQVVVTTAGGTSSGSVLSFTTN